MRDDLPPGVVTFLFTDVEGSTRLLEELGAEEYAAINDAHRVVIRGAVAAHGGVEVSTHGDAFFCVFTSPGDAARAAVAAQAGLVGGTVRVRIGIHVGEAVVADRTYVGMDVNRAARIMDAGHGGQVLVSEPVRRALADDVPCVDLGEHRLKDLGAPVRLFQIGDGSFPPLRTLPVTNLPVPSTPFVGRARELGDLVELLRREDVPSVTLTGPGGTGKTRVALQVAAEVGDAFPDGVVWVPLAPLRDPTLVSAAVAAALGVAERPGEDVEETLRGWLRGRRSLILLDNAEHLEGVAQLIGALVGSTAARWLVTSRERLAVAGEVVYPVLSLAERDARALFVGHARRLDPAFVETPAVGELCRRLDGLPLAVELAAARTGVLSPEQLLERLGERLDLLKGGRDADPRQRSLRATIEWSVELLSSSEQELLASLSVFAGGCTVETAEAVCGADLDDLQSLVDKSLVRRRPTPVGPRLWMLETVRQYAAEQLELAGRSAQLRDAHAQWALDLVGRWTPRLVEHDQDVAFATLDEEVANVHVAIARLEDDEDHERYARLLLEAHEYLWRRGLGSELMPRFHALLDHELEPRTRVAVLGEVALDALARGDGEGDAVTRLEEAVEISRRLGDQRLVAEACHKLGLALDETGDAERAAAFVSRSLEEFTALGDARGIAVSKWALAHLAAHTDPERALALLDDALAYHRDADDALGVAWIQASRACLERERGRRREALACLAESLETYAQLGLAAGCSDALVAYAELVADSEPASARSAVAAVERELDAELSASERARLRVLDAMLPPEALPIDVASMLVAARDVIAAHLAVGD